MKAKGKYHIETSETPLLRKQNEIQNKTVSGTANLAPAEPQWIDLGPKSVATFRKVDLSTVKYFDQRERVHKVRHEDFHFVSSCAHNAAFDKHRGDGESRVYVPVHNKQNHLYICFFDVNSPRPSCEFVAQLNIQATDETGKTVGQSHLVCFGCALADDGILWLAVFNANAVVGYDLISRHVKYQFNDIPSPNDVTVAAGGKLLYVACGAPTATRTPINRPAAATAGNESVNHVDVDDFITLEMPSHGAIQELHVVDPNKSPSAATPHISPSGARNTLNLPAECASWLTTDNHMAGSPLSSPTAASAQAEPPSAPESPDGDTAPIPQANMKALAGICFHGNRLFYSELFDMHSFVPPVTEPPSPSLHSPSTAAGAPHSFKTSKSVRRLSEGGGTSKSTRRLSVGGGGTTPQATAGMQVVHKVTRRGTDNVTLWTGMRVGDEEHCYFLDGLSNWHIVEHGQDHLVGSLYRRVDREQVLLMNSPLVDEVGWACARGLSCLYSGLHNVFASIGIARGRMANLSSYSRAQMPRWFGRTSHEDCNDLCFAVFDTIRSHAQHFRIRDIAQAIGGADKQVETFDGNVNKVSVHGNKFVFVNFTNKHLLLMDATEVKSMLGKIHVVSFDMEGAADAAVEFA